MFTVTQLAQEKLSELLKVKGKAAVRIRIAPFGMTGGYVYDMDFASKPAPGDAVVGPELFLEGKNRHRFETITLDYNQQEQGFVFVHTTRQQSRPTSHS